MCPSFTFVSIARIERYYRQPGLIYHTNRVVILYKRIKVDVLVCGGHASNNAVPNFAIVCYATCNYVYTLFVTYVHQQRNKVLHVSGRVKGTRPSCTSF